ncbi:SCO4225 family membrane protein [Actinomadura chokoriensis]|uniref:DUF2637 domain-containing protein n=1 Tax=Actinomadura chokoriensis TaxID=454156 RepID=A0ABV4QUS4_9ACTN
MTKNLRRRVAASIAVAYALVVVAAGVDAVLASRPDESGLSALGLVLVTMPLGDFLYMMLDWMLGGASDQLEPALPLSVMTLGGLVQAWLLWVITRGIPANE